MIVLLKHTVWFQYFSFLLFTIRILWANLKIAINDSEVNLLGFYLFAVLCYNVITNKEQIWLINQPLQ